MHCQWVRRRSIRLDLLARVGPTSTLRLSCVIAPASTATSAGCVPPPNSLPIPWSCQPIGCNGPVYITTSPTGADSGCSITTGVIVPREVVDSRGLASHSSVPCGSRSSIRCVSARSSIAASHPRVAFGRQLSSSSFGHRGEGTKAHLKLQDVHPGRIPPCPTYRICAGESTRPNSGVFHN